MTTLPSRSATAVPTWRVLEGDCVEAMGTMDAASVDSIVCDPPYGLGFMGKKWDALPPGLPWAQECVRVLKPGGYLLAFGGTRTYHRLVVALEDGGMEIRDMIVWLYGSGFPKNQACLKPAQEPIVLARKPTKGSPPLNIDVCRLPTSDALGGGAELDVQADKPEGWDRPWRNDPEAQAAHAERVRAGVEKAEQLGRWPANVVMDAEAGALLDEQTGTLTSGKEPAGGFRRNAPEEREGIYGGGKGLWKDEQDAGTLYGDSGGASRFFYCPKPDNAERHNAGKNPHPTVKPIELMRWLCRLVTPAGGTVLDPFTGSGTTGIAAMREGFTFVGIEREPDYVRLARDRIVADAPLLNSFAEAA